MYDRCLTGVTLGHLANLTKQMQVNAISNQNKLIGLNYLSSTSAATREIRVIPHSRYERHQDLTDTCLPTIDVRHQLLIVVTFWLQVWSDGESIYKRQKNTAMFQHLFG
jgi:hypothetical protein